MGASCLSLQLWDGGSLPVRLTCACAGCVAGFPVDDGWERALTMAAWSEYSSGSWCPPPLTKSWESSAVPHPSRNLLPRLDDSASLPSQGRTPVSALFSPQDPREVGSSNCWEVKLLQTGELLLKQGLVQRNSCELMIFFFFLPQFVCPQLALWLYTFPLSGSPFHSWEIIISVLGTWR